MDDNVKDILRQNFEFFIKNSDILNKIFIFLNKNSIKNSYLYQKTTKN